MDIPASSFLAPVSAGDMAHHIVVQFADPAGATQPGLEEADYTAETDDRGVYVNEPGAPWSPADPAIDVEVRFRGKRPPAGTRLQIAQYSPDEPGFNEFNWNSCPTHCRRRRLRRDAERRRRRDPWLPRDRRRARFDGQDPRVGAALGPPILRFAPVAPGDPEPTPPDTIAFDTIVRQFFANVVYCRSTTR